MERKETAKAIKCENFSPIFLAFNGLFGSNSDILNPRWLLTNTDRSDHEVLITEISGGGCGSSMWNPHPFMERRMSTPLSVETDRSCDLGFDPDKPVIISANDARQGPSGQELLYILGFGTTGAIFALATVLTYFDLFWA